MTFKQHFQQNDIFATTKSIKNITKFLDNDF